MNNAGLSRYDAVQGYPQTQDAVILEIEKQVLVKNVNWPVAHRNVTQSFINPY